MYWANDYRHDGAWAEQHSTDLHLHPQFDLENLFYDLGVVILAQDSPSEPIAVPGEPPGTGWLGADHLSTLVGFGVTHWNKTDAGIKRSVAVAVEHWDPNYLYFYGGEQQSCGGDSGGPLLTDNHGQWQVGGIISWGDKYCSSVGAATRLDTRLDWIESYTGGWEPEDDPFGPGSDLFTPPELFAPEDPPPPEQPRQPPQPDDLIPSTNSAAPGEPDGSCHYPAKSLTAPGRWHFAPLGILFAAAARRRRQRELPHG